MNLAVPLLLALVWFPSATMAAPEPVSDPDAVRAAYEAVLSAPEYQHRQSPGLSARLNQWLLNLFQSFQSSLDGREFDTGLMRFSQWLTGSILGVSALLLAYGLMRWPMRYGSIRFGPLLRLPRRTVRVESEGIDPRLRAALKESDWVSALPLAWQRFQLQLERDRLLPDDRSRTNGELIARLTPRVPTETLRAALRFLASRHDRVCFGGMRPDRADWEEWSRTLHQLARALRLRYRPLP